MKLSIRMILSWSLISSAIALSNPVIAQTTDTITLVNADVLIGEIKELNRGVLTVETVYSDADFTIEWDQVTRVQSEAFFLITLQNGTRLNGPLLADPDNDGNAIVGQGIEAQSVPLIQIVYLKSVKTSFISRLSILLEAGLNLTKANNLRQFTSRSAFGYAAETWDGSATYNMVTSSQDSVANTRRIDANIGARWFLPRNWYIGLKVPFLSNDEQRLKLRVTPQVLAGNFIVRSNSLYVTAGAGLAYNSEVFQSDEPSRNSLEGLIFGEVNLFDIGDLSMKLTESFYPSITEGGRLRSDTTLDLKYDFYKDFYIKLGFTYNYDSEPTEGASTTDYVFQTTVGWEL